MSPDLGRRGFLLLGGGVLLAGCSDGNVERPRSPASSAAAPTMSGSRPTAAPRASATLPVVTRWHPDPNDITPAAKVAAARHVERQGRSRTTSVQVLDAQYGGLLAASASVLVVCRSDRLRAGAVVHGGHTYDVRLVRSGSAWRVIAVHPSHPGPAQRPLTTRQKRVLASDRIGLPPAGRADVASGQVHASVLTAMLALSQEYRIDVSVVRSGHPTYVFGTDRLSDHPRGRAFDTWRVDGHAVVSRSTPRRLVTGYMQTLARLGSSNVGGPYRLGSAPQFFSDDTHHDHVHAGFAG